MQLYQNVDRFCEVGVFGGRGVGKREYLNRMVILLGAYFEGHGTGLYCNLEVTGPQWSHYFNLRVYQHPRWVTDRTNRYILIFDLTNRSSLLNQIDGFVELVSGRDGKRGAALLVGNKVDAVRPGDEEVDASRRMARRFAEEGGLVYVETSALTGEGVVEATYLLLNIDTQQSMKVRLMDECAKPAGVFMDTSMPLPL